VPAHIDYLHTSTTLLYHLLYPKMSSLSITERAAAVLKAEAAARLVAEQAALAAEVERLRSRSPLEILQDEMAEMKRQMAAASRSPEPEALHMRERVIQLDTLYKSSLEELATARAEIAALKSVVGDLIALRHENPRGGAIRAELNAMRGQGLFERLGVPAYFVTTVNGNQFHRSVPIDWQKYAEKGHDGSDIEYPTLV
jgi:hypothetical protein